MPNKLYDDIELAEFLERYVRHQIRITGGKTARTSRMSQTQTEHEKILRAISARDADAARAAAREHFRRGHRKNRTIALAVSALSSIKEQPS